MHPAPERAPRWSRVALPQRVRNELAGWSLSALPEEACGVLLGVDEDESLRIDHVTLGRNVAAQPSTSFRLHPADLLASYVKASELDLDVVGIWHSHPHGPANLSQADLQQAWGGWLSLLIVPDSSADCILSAFRLQAGRGVELRIEG